MDKNRITTLFGTYCIEAHKASPSVDNCRAIGFVLVMVCAVVFHATRKEYGSIGVNIVLLLLAAFITVGYLI